MGQKECARNEAGDIGDNGTEDGTLFGMFLQTESVYDRFRNENEEFTKIIGE